MPDTDMLVNSDLSSPDLSDMEDDEALLTGALNQKEEGNAKLKVGDFASARKAYEEGLKQLNKRTGKDQGEHITVKQSLNLNLALACMKLGAFFEAVQAANNVLTSDPDNQKALFRRGVCHGRLGNFEEARVDLVKLINLDPKNIEGRRELKALQAKAEESSARQKLAFSGIFSKSGGSLYQDREEEVQRQKKAEEARQIALRKEFDEEMAALDVEKRISFEEWNTKRNETSSAPEAKQNRVEESKPTQSVTEISKSRTEKRKEPEAEFDEDDLKILEETKKKGYCYFRRDLTDEEKRLRETAHVPRKLEAQGASPTETTTTSRRGVSEWNAGGATYEEKDATKWCITMLQSILKNARWESKRQSSDPIAMLENPEGFQKLLEGLKATQSGYSVNSLDEMLSQMHCVEACVVGDPELKGEAQVMVVRGTKRWYYEFSLTCDWQIQIKAAEGSPRLYRGKLKVDEISSSNSGALDNGQWEREGKIDVGDDQIVDMAIRALKKEFQRCVTEFEKLYHDRQ